MQLPFSATPTQPAGPTLVVHGAADLRRAIGDAAAAGHRTLRVLSAPAAACFAGPAWWRALLALGEAMARDAGLLLFDMLDCGASPGRALEALRLGQRALVLQPSTQWRAVQERAELLGALLLPERPPAFDLGTRNAAHGLHAFLWTDDTVPPPG